jgi:2-methylcitrate dehydratase PrpD
MPVPPTRALAQLVCRSAAGSLPGNVRDEGRRAILNWMGCAIGASDHPTVNRALAAVSATGPSPWQRRGTPR